MPNRISVEKFKLQGFRAYLQSQEFTLRRGSQPLSLAIYAPNVKGKSSLVDAFEFYFSSDATLARLGQREAEGRAGPDALTHAEAAGSSIQPEVHMWFKQGTTDFDGVRPVARPAAALSPAAVRVKQAVKAPFIIRGYELRGFVENDTPQKRYEELSGWFGLAPLVEIQRNLAQLRRQLKQHIRADGQMSERLRDLARITNNAVMQWNETVLVQWVNNTLLHPLDAELSIRGLAEDDAAYAAVTARKRDEEERMGLSTIKSLIAQIDAIHKTGTAGNITKFETAISAHQVAVRTESEERGRASAAVFSEVWTKTKDLLGNAAVNLDACPACETPFDQTPHRSRAALTVHLEGQLVALQSYRTAAANLMTTATALDNAHQTARHSVDTLISSLSGTSYESEIDSVKQYQTALTAWSRGQPAVDSTDAVTALTAVGSNLETAKTAIEQMQGDNTYAKALRVLDELIRIGGDIGRIERTKTELALLQEQLETQVGIINRRIVGHIQGVVDDLKTRVNQIYNAIQGTTGSPIRLDLPPENEANQQRLFLRLEFSASQPGVIPSGYLSDSQLHTLALSLRLAAIEMLNTDFPFIVFDDVVTSYDVDHRKTLAALLASEFVNHQIVIVSHDEMFFRLLSDHLPAANWNFKRITRLLPSFGPKFHDHQTDDAVIEAKLRDEEPAATDIRQAEEDWLFQIAREFGVNVRMRAVNKPYEFSRAELATALASFLKEKRLIPPTVPGVANPFLNTLMTGTIENFGSHFSDNPGQTGSAGDERTRWREFKFFRDLFACPGCGGKRFHRPEPVSTPLCKASSCNSPFTFARPTMQTEDGLAGAAA